MDRYRGFLHPPKTADYTFYLASDDDGILLISRDDDAENAVVISQVDGWTGAEEWKKSASQRSVPVHLEAGKKYYIEALHRQAEGADSFAVGWESAEMKLGVIVGKYLSPWRMPSLDDGGGASEPLDSILREYWLDAPGQNVKDLVFRMDVRPFVEAFAMKLDRHSAVPEARKMNLGSPMKAEDEDVLIHTTGNVDFVSATPGIMVFNLDSPTGRAKVIVQDSRITGQSLAMSG